MPGKKSATGPAPIPKYLEKMAPLKPMKKLKDPGYTKKIAHFERKVKAPYGHHAE